MTDYPNIFAVISDLPSLNDWLMVDEDEWEKDPKNAPIYIFDQDEMDELEKQGLAKVGEYFDEFPLPLAIADKPITYLLDSGNLEGVIYHLAKYSPNYTNDELVQALNYYCENDYYFEPKNVQVTMNIWTIAVSPQQLGLLKEIQQSFTQKLDNSVGIIWIKSNKPIPIVEMATCYGDGRFVNPDEFNDVLKRLDFDKANAVCLLAEGAVNTNMENLLLNRDEKQYVVYLGKFDMIFNEET